MKTKILYILCTIVLIGWQASAVAQEDGGRQGRGDFSGHWQMGLPLSNDYIDDNFSGWGANFEGHYYVSDRIAVGAFLSWQTFMHYFERNTYQFDGTNYGGSVRMDRYQTVYELPFGLSSKFHFMASSGMFDPYFGLKLGANYSTQRRYYNIYEDYSENWGFVVLPEIGAVISPLPNQAIGLHLAVFYSYATNKSDNSAIDVDGLNNIGFRVGLNFRF